MKFDRCMIDRAIQKSIRFEHPDFIPMKFGINDACWDYYPHEALWDLMEAHPMLFPDFRRPQEPFSVRYSLVAQKDHPYRDDWGCLWTTTVDGITGTVTDHPLKDWSDFENYPIPDPEKCMGIGPIDWEQRAAAIRRRLDQKEFVKVGLRHGHTFLQASDIRGYQNLLFDMEDEEPRLRELLDRITEFNLFIINRYLELGAQMISIPEDLGMQQGPMLSPENFKEYILPCYRRLVQPVKDAGKLVHMHSDGDIRTLVPMLMECGIDVLNLQDLVNGIDWIRDHLKGKLCIELDVDRQRITPFGTPGEVEELILREVRELGSPAGGLMMIYGLFPGVPLENAGALMDAMEKYAFYHQ